MQVSKAIQNRKKNCGVAVCDVFVRLRHFVQAFLPYQNDAYIEYYSPAQSIFTNFCYYKFNNFHDIH